MSGRSRREVGSFRDQYIMAYGLVTFVGLIVDEYFINR